MKVKDHLGNVYTSRKDMLKEYNVNVETFKYRKKQGWSLSECLGVNKHNIVIAPNGREFSDDTAMAKSYGIDNVVYRGRKGMGWSTEECLELAGRGLDAKIHDGKEVNALLQIEPINERNWYIANPADSRLYYKVKVKSTGEIKYMNSDQIKAYPEGWKTL